MSFGEVGLHGDGRLLALNSYENRVYQIGMEDGPPLVAKFYRPQRWSDAAILEASDSRQAMPLVEEHDDLDLVLLDLNLPDRDGFSVLVELRKNYPSISVVVMSEFGRRVAENGGGGTDHPGVRGPAVPRAIV